MKNPPKNHQEAYNFALRYRSHAEVENAFCACDSWTEALEMLGLCE